jgi:HSP20 family protein
MTKSFFEKLTGASSEEENELEIPTDKKSKSRPKSGSRQRSGKTIKKEPLTMPKAKKIIKKKEEKEVAENKDWLEETEGEEGQLTIDVYQNPSNIVIKSTIAGVSPEDIDISITNDMVTIRGKRTKDEKIEAENYYYQELYWGAFSRSVILPVEVEADKAKAGIKNGILTIKLPKSEKIKTKKIQVKPME